ncbi:nicotinamide riboside kinase 1-like isoform X3 [Denticeps clupeoides]|uniref:Nicotinamide riboside kinase 1 n=1 Tax=Denticeps clupeoides TaxID=299321 RepID=A0AAY4CIV6_9TELE|nr:nicotinamide riboside kinase 1-like isoform X3 [Denticeps clupeoides]XP_028822695.1 nicotinamide riboside kinase 1-like isoform X3 [Denticeps clupeoides]
MEEATPRRQNRKRLVVGVGGVTNGGKSTLSMALQQRLANSCVIAQDSYFKDESELPEDDRGFKHYDTLQALRMDKMMGDVESWFEDPPAFMASRGLKISHPAAADQQEVFILIVEGFLIFNHGPLNALMDLRYFLHIPYDVCRERRSSRAYDPPDPPGFFEGYVWPMFLKNRAEMEASVTDLVYLDGLRGREDLQRGVLEELRGRVDAIRNQETGC